MSASDEENDDFVDLDAELDAIDVDKDFSLWTSFRSRKSIASSSGTLDLDDIVASNEDDTSVPNPLEMDDLEYWRARIMRDEVFSPKYKPSPAEEQEFKELLKYLGMERKKLFEKQDVKWNELSALTNIVLKKGPVLCQGQERELILLTNGFVLAQVEETNKNALARLISRSYEQCDLYNAIQHIRSAPVVVDVIVEVEDKDENVTQENIELEIEAGQVVVKDQVNEVEAEVTDDDGSVSASDEDSAASGYSVEAPIVSHSGDDTKNETHVTDAEIKESTSTDDEESVAGDEDANSENEDNAATKEPTKKSVVSNNVDDTKEGDSLHDDDSAENEQLKEPSEESSSNEDDGDSGYDSKSEQDEEEGDDDVSKDEGSRRSIQEDGSIESAEEKKGTPPDEAPASPRLFFGGLFAGSKKSAPEEQDSDSDTGSQDKKQATANTKSDKSGDNEKEAAQEEAPLSPGGSSDKRQFFGLFGAKKNADKGSDESSPTAASEKTSEMTPEKHVKILVPPKMKQVTVQEERFIFVIKTDTDEFYFECATKDHKEAWLEALERVLVKTRSRVRSKQERIRGWQHALVQTSLYSAAVTGLDDLCCREWLEKVNAPDKYNHLAPLHYATMLNMMHIMDWLLRNGADPEVKDKDDRTPMYYAQRDGLMGAQALLLDYGAKRSHLCDIEERGVLFQGAAQVAEAKSAKSAMNGSLETKQQDAEASSESTLKSHHAEATKAHGAMNDAMNELRIRGEKINDLAEKANALEDNVNTYGDLAKQMKARAKKKKWYNLK